MANQIPPVGRNVGVYVHNGSEWRKLKGNGFGHALMSVLSTATRIEVYKAWGLTIGAGQTSTLLSTTAGRGRLLHCLLRVDGLTTGASGSWLSFFVDGEASASTKIFLNHIYYYYVGERIADMSTAGIITWDTTNHIYQAWFHFGPTFESSLKITFSNNDTDNPITLRYAIWVEWWK